MDIATVSVISSSVVALGTVGANFMSGERQRRHEADLDFERRAWERKSDALFVVIERARSLADSSEPVTDDNRLTYALDLSMLLDALLTNRATVEAFASSDCRATLTALINTMQSQGVKPGVGEREARYRNLAMEAGIDNPERWDIYRKWWKEAEREATTHFNPDLSALHPLAERLLEAARLSVRRPKE